MLLSKVSPKDGDEIEIADYLKVPDPDSDRNTTGETPPGLSLDELDKIADEAKARRAAMTDEQKVKQVENFRRSRALANAVANSLVDHVVYLAGDSVMLQTGGPLMTVDASLDDEDSGRPNDLVFCTWFVGDRPECRDFHRNALQRIRKGPGHDR